MGFEKGHKLAKGGARPGAGRKKLPSTLIKEAIARNDERLPELFDILYAKAQGRDSIECPYCHKSFNDPTAGDREAIINLIDRSLGKVRAKTDIEVTRGEDAVSAGEVARFFQQMNEEKKRLAALSESEQSAELYTRQYGDKENWPSWAIKAVEAKELTEGVTVGITEDEG